MRSYVWGIDLVAKVKLYVHKSEVSTLWLRLSYALILTLILIAKKVLKLIVSFNNENIL